LTKGIDDAYRGTVPAGRYPPVALCVEVDPRQVDVNVHPTKQLVRFSDEREVRLALSKAISNAIQGTDDSLPDHDGRNTESETSSGTSSRPTSEGDAQDAPLVAPERHPTEDRPSSEATSPIPPAERLASNNEGTSASPDRLFGASEKGSRSEAPKVPDLSEQRQRIEQAPLFLGLAPQLVGWSGETCHALETCAW
jgi:DNA mismatch repair protein MutL